MKALFIGGTGIISMAITRLLADSPDWELYLLNKGSRSRELPPQVKTICADISDEAAVADLIKDMSFDVVADFISFVPSQLESRYRLFKGKTKQFIFISSASAYQKPLSDYRINEGTPLANPYWEYSRNKIACEEYLSKLYREDNFPITIVRPSHTYDDRYIPLGVHGTKGSWQVVKRMLDGKPVIIHGDGTSLWTMTHNSDFAKGFAGLMGNIHAIGESVQITSDETLTWNQIYKSIADAVGAEFKPYYVPSDFLAKCSGYDFTGSLIGDKSNSVVFDNAKLKRLVPGFTATKRFDEGVREVIGNVMSNKNLQVEDSEFDSWCDIVIEFMDEAIENIKGSHKIINGGKS
ncbi:MAG: NAD-dependent epimerase/dehydratase family protein [Oscillospiraceae bacterium]|nr:NAD-dependent epimerase/dehydratase family protein [Oscillospiraceae bacterium]